MYQLTWSEAPDTNPTGVRLFETWREVKFWIADNEKTCNYSIGVVFESTVQEHVGFENQSALEKSFLMDALAEAVPDMKEPGEIAAALMNFAHAYWTHKQMVEGFVMLSQLANSIDSQTPDKNKLH